jgi:hypothetical protein
LSSTLAVTGTTTLTGAATLTANPTLSAGTANGVLYLDGTKVASSGSALTFDGTNFGVGVTPSAWESTCRMLQLGAVGTVGRANSGQTQLGFNYFINSSGQYVYIQSLHATRHEQISGEHRFFTAGSGTAGNVISFTQAMTLDASGNLGIGTASPGAKLDVVGAVRSTNAGNENYFLSDGTNRSSVQQSGAALYFNTNDNLAAHGNFIWRSSNAATTRMTLDPSGNLGLNTTTFGTSAAGVLSLGTGTAPTTGPADTVQLFSVDRSAGNTIPAVRCEGSGVTNAGITSTTVTHKIAMQVNGTIYYLLATTNAT